MKIGLPNALLYSRYQVLWKNFFTALHVETAVSEPTNKEILRLGMEASIDESCLSAKIYLGHVRSLIGTCDYILIPRISNWGRQRNMCTRFESLYDLCCNTFRCTGQKFISYNVAESKKLTEEKAFLDLGQELGFSRKEALKQSLRVSPTLKWEINREIVGSLKMHQSRIDGIILLSAFPCGPDSMVNDVIAREFRDIPILHLVLDAQSGTAGMETRMESFLDILKFKKGIL